MYFAPQSRSIRLRRLAPILGAVVTLSCATTTTFAQDSDDRTHTAPPSGSIIVLREVPYGSALERQHQAPALEVRTGPERMLLPALANGLRPLSNEEQGRIVASSLASALSTGGNNFPAGTELASSAIGDPGGQRAQASGSFGGVSVGGVVNDALGAMPNVGALVRNAGSGQ